MSKRFFPWTWRVQSTVLRIVRHKVSHFRFGLLHLEFCGVDWCCTAHISGDTPSYWFFRQFFTCQLFRVCKLFHRVQRCWYQINAPMIPLLRSPGIFPPWPSGHWCQVLVAAEDLGFETFLRLSGVCPVSLIISILGLQKIRFGLLLSSYCGDEGKR